MLLESLSFSDDEQHPCSLVGVLRETGGKLDGVGGVLLLFLVKVE